MRSERVLNRVRLVVLLLLGVRERSVRRRAHRVPPCGERWRSGANAAGFGLWIAREIVTEHSGTLQSENRAEGGARFTMRFPVARPREARLSAAW
ncbi:MAG: hypothetical protein M3125_02510 [Gemmatimonadota bacterium]|nr:hypothetical protein [Gemmatimonadota bacterium]